ncbi:hypothetical protein [Novosphingobium sp. CECT 9465]|uniref:hypothetical protein n=1 Tax=Novosphingobium sp. CECT 9465 TaxID=2829794 RepID=UPI001E60E981|nr:hypothetical protein [Novosphingobium sp. CECT 9465]CAH0497219.1 hypothetical protein NVSP9465_02271 [Novosphingobium sp. CECT 9465]
MCLGPCGDWHDYQSQIDARPELRGNPPAVTIAELCRLYDLEWDTVLGAIEREEVDVVMKEGYTHVTLESAQVRFGPAS